MITRMPGPGRTNMAKPDEHEEHSSDGDADPLPLRRMNRTVTRTGTRSSAQLFPRRFILRAGTAREEPASHMPTPLSG